MCLRTVVEGSPAALTIARSLLRSTGPSAPHPCGEDRAVYAGAWTGPEGGPAPNRRIPSPIRTLCAAASACGAARSGGTPAGCACVHAGPFSYPPPARTGWLGGRPRAGPARGGVPRQGPARRAGYKPPKSPGARPCGTAALAGTAPRGYAAGARSGLRSSGGSTATAPRPRSSSVKAGLPQYGW